MSRNPARMMLAQCPGLAIQPAITTDTVGWPAAIFSPQDGQT
jgi:hypothetical protein